MRSFLKAYKLFFITLFLLSVIILYFIYSALNVYKPLPIYQPTMVSTALVDSTLHYKKKYHKIANFKLTNQNGEIVTHNTYKDKIYVADFFFTTCQSICPVMTGHMLEIQKQIINDDEVMLLSHTVIPETDTVEQLKKYALKKGVKDDKWNLVTGAKKEIYKLARKSYLAVKDNGYGGPFDMIHTENFMLIDKKKQIRGFYDGTDPEAIKTLLKDIAILKQE